MAKRRIDRFNGVLNINKPAGMTSHDVVDHLRKAAKMRRVGHTGTLDPMATGVLPLCLGKATKIVQYIIAQDKEYIVDMKLGVVTDSQDTTGTMIEEHPIPAYAEADIDAVLDRFRGEIWQTPPMISAKHHKGKRLYELAREGVEVEREPCKITLHELRLEAVRLPVVRFRVTCSKGTYVRTLCHDIGQALGCGACMAGLIRSRCGTFHLDDAVALDSLKSPDDIEEHLYNLNEALAALPAVFVGVEGKASINCGRALTGGIITRRNGDFHAGSLVRMTARDGTLLALGEALLNSDQLDAFAGNLQVIKPVKVFSN
ncbi:tRNA pseudouridine(55) synthase TruB [bacterium]|nr:tRNA pseudouridine(55) synthase TruB [bacterium]